MAGAAILAVVLAGAGHFAGHASAGGPSTLAAAVTQAQHGKLPCGNTSGVSLGTGAATGSGGTAGGFGGGRGFFLQRLCGSGGVQTGGGVAGRGFSGAGGLFGPGAVSGQIAAVHSSTVRLRTRAGALNVTVGSGTAITRTVTGRRADLKPGLTASVTSTAAAGGRRTATRIFILAGATAAG